MTPKEVLEYAAKNDAVMVDLKFMDFLGTWQHFTVPLNHLKEDNFEKGYGFDGSSIRGWQPINASDMVVLPDAATAVMDPMMEHATLSLICDIADPITKESYSRDPRHIAKKAENYLRSTGIGDTVYFGPEAEFFIFDDVRFDQTQNRGFYQVDSAEGRWNTGREEEGGNLGHKPAFKGGYFPVPPSDSLQDLRTSICLEMAKVGIDVEAQHHEVASGGQCEIDMRFDSMVVIADRLMWYKYIVKNVCNLYGKSATFMPKPIYGDNGSGMHAHQSIWKEGKNTFAGDGYGGMSDIGMWYIGGILKHARALCAFTNPTVNSYRRLVPGFEAPVNLAYSSRNRSAAVRLPIVDDSPSSKRIEVRFPDPSANPYLAFSAMFMAGLDGIEHKINPGSALDKDIYGLSPEELKDIPSTPGSLSEALDCLEEDHGFLLKGDVFTDDVLDVWCRYKREAEVDPIRLHPTPMEFGLYYDC